MSHGQAQDDAVPAGSASAPAAAARAVSPAERSPARRRLLRWTVGLLLALAAGIGALFAGVLYFNLESSPMVGRMVRDRLVEVLQAQLDPGLTLSIGTVDIQRGSDATRIAMSDVRLRDETGRSLLHAPSGRVTVATMPLLGLKIVPRAVTLEAVHAGLVLLEEGGIALREAEDTPAQAAENASANAAANAPAAPADTAASEAEVQPLHRLEEGVGRLLAALSAFRQSIGGRLPDVAIGKSRLSIRDARTGKSIDIDGVGGRLTTDADGKASARLTIGETPAIALDLVMSPPGPGQTLVAQSADVPLQALSQALGLADDWIDAGARGRVELKALIGTGNQVQTVSVRLGSGPAVLHIDRKNMAPIPVERAHVALDWAAGQDRIAVGVEADSDGSRIRLKGEAQPTDAESWRLDIADAGSVLAPLIPAEPPVVFDQLKATFTAMPRRRELVIDNVEGRRGNASVNLRGVLTFDDDIRPGLTLNLRAADTEGRMALRLWPAFAASEVRRWVVGHVRAGHLDNLEIALALPPDVMADAIADRPLPATSVALTFAASRTTLLPGPGMPLAQNLAGTGTVTGRSVSLAIAPGGYIDAGQGRKIALGDGSFTVADVSRKPPDGRLKLGISGPIDAALDVVRAPGLQAHVPKGLETIKARGIIDGDLTVGLRLTPQMNPADMRVAIAAQLKNLNIDKAVADEKIEAGAFTLQAERDSFVLKGDARLFGAPATIEVKGAGKAPAVANVSLVLDDAARARKGINLGAGATGPLAVKIAARLDGDNEGVTLDADLGRMTIMPVLPGIGKRAGLPGRLRGVARELDSGGWALDKMELDAGPLSARGSVQVGKDGSFLRAQLSHLKMAQGDAMQLDAERAGSLLKLNVRANSVDGRPYLKSILAGGIEKTGGRDVDLTLRSTVLSGFNGELVSNADLKLAIRGGGMQAFTLNGRFDQGAVSARLQPGGGKQGTLTIASDDGGGFLRFFDLYNRMRGGRLDLVAQLGTGSQAGTLSVRNFILRDEPAMRRLVATADTQGQDSGDSARLSQQPPRAARNGQDVPFTRMSVQFARQPGRLDLKDGTLIGPEIGGNIEGRLDFARDAANLSGTFVPAYSLNNALSNVPLVGPLITGGKNEGLFAVRYHITGRASAPTLQVNALSAIAPGFLRRLIDFRGSGRAAPPPAPER